MTSPKMPDGNNVYGPVIAPQGLQPILRAMMPLVGEKRAYIYRSQFIGAVTLTISTDTADFGSTLLEYGSRHLLNGGCAGVLDDVVVFVRSSPRAFSPSTTSA